MHRKKFWKVRSIAISCRKDTRALTFENLLQFNGMAPEAKLVFDDIYANGDLTPPDDLEHALFPEPYRLGARVRSESWGGDR